MDPFGGEIRLQKRLLLQSQRPASSSSTRTEAARVLAFGSPLIKSAKNRPRRFYKTQCCLKSRLLQLLGRVAGVVSSTRTVAAPASDSVSQPNTNGDVG